MGMPKFEGKGHGVGGVAALREKDRDAGEGRVKFPARLQEGDAGTGRVLERKREMRAARVSRLRETGGFEGQEKQREGERRSQRAKKGI